VGNNSHFWPVYGKTRNGKRLFIPPDDDRYAIVETASVKTIIK
jgi:hypothetical protein